MNVKMGGTLEKDGTITCSVANTILQPHFALKPSEMRKLSRQDRAKSQSYVDEGGRRARAHLTVLSSWQMRLVQSAEEFFGSEDTPALDGDTPILKLVCRD